MLAKWTLGIGVVGAIFYSSVGLASDGDWTGPGWYEVQIDRPPLAPYTFKVGGPYNNEQDCMAKMIPRRERIVRKFGDKLDWKCIHYTTKAQHGGCAPYGVNQGCK